MGDMQLPSFHTIIGFSFALLMMSAPVASAHMGYHRYAGNNWWQYPAVPYSYATQSSGSRYIYSYGPSYTVQPASYYYSPTTNYYPYSSSYSYPYTYPSYYYSNPVVTTMTVAIQNFSFQPTEVDVMPGMTVTWVNDDSVPHTVTSDVPGGPSSGVLYPGQSYSYTFPYAGAFPYHCQFHPEMRGVVGVGGY